MELCTKGTSEKICKNASKEDKKKFKKEYKISQLTLKQTGIY
jgi:hypothetical protein